MPLTADAARLVEWRLDAGWRQHDAAREFGVSIQTYDAWERGAPIPQAVLHHIDDIQAGLVTPHRPVAIPPPRPPATLLTRAQMAATYRLYVRGWRAHAIARRLEAPLDAVVYEIHRRHG